MTRLLLSWPRPDPGNPYLVRLGEALRDRGVAVRSARYLAALCASPGAASWLHLHWPEWMLHDPRRPRYRARIAWLLGLLELARARGVRLAWTAHNLLGHDDPHPDLGLAARRALLRRCAVVFGHFPAAEQDVRALGFRGRFALTPHPHFADDYPAPWDRVAVRARLGLRQGELLLCSVGAVEPYKNLPLLARTFREVAPAGVRWIVAGRARDEHARALRAAAAGDPRIELRFGFAPRDELASLVSAADAVLLGYRDFYTSGAAVLALSLGTPVVGPARHHLATLEGRSFFVPLPRVDGASLRAALAAVGAMAPTARQEARAHAVAAGWDGAAATVAETLFGVAA